ncbi:hypothetical protein [Streptomyces sp. NPDC017202]|uniref:hypothetical protein n=1 Tax=Streptomyces sp. NPDC017202 TaxID=3364981 RepID=UPI00378F5688
MARGQYIDPRAARITFQQYAEKWVTHAPDPNTQASMESQLRLHAFPYLGPRPLGSFQPAHIRDWVGRLQENGIRGSYARTISAYTRTSCRPARSALVRQSLPSSVACSRTRKLSERHWRPSSVFTSEPGWGVTPDWNSRSRNSVRAPGGARGAIGRGCACFRSGSPCASKGAQCQPSVIRQNTTVPRVHGPPARTGSPSVQ